MQKYFNIPLQFDHDRLEETIVETSLESKGYCCFIDSNTLVEVHKSPQNKISNVINNSLVNSCDGSYIAKLASLIYKKHLKAYNGPTFFNKFIYEPDKQCIIGNTLDVFNKIKEKVSKKGEGSNLYFIPLPFMSVENFDYKKIADEVNTIKPRYIWVSLGAPKQEIFMSNLVPLIDRGVLLGVGAALNYFSGEIDDIPSWATKHNLIWLFRILTEPRKQTKRVMKILRYYPRICYHGVKEVRN